MRSARRHIVRKRVFLGLLLAVWLTPAWGATLSLLSLNDLISKSTTIVQAQVTGSSASYTGSVIYTHYKVNVLAQWKGPAQTAIDVMVPGGKAKGMRQICPGVPQLAVGQQYVLFLWTSRFGLTYTMGFTQGVFNLQGYGRQSDHIADARHRDHAGAGDRTSRSKPAHQHAAAAVDFRHRGRRYKLMRLHRWSLLAGVLAAAATPAAAYYHYVHYLNSSAPYAVAFERYDLTALPDNTVTFFVANAGPASFTANDSFPSLLEQIRNATRVWNAVSSSELRVGFGGLQAAGAQQNAPTGVVAFFRSDPARRAGLRRPDSSPTIP